LDLKIYHKAIFDIENDSNIEKAIDSLNKIKKKEPYLYENCKGWLNKAYKKLKKQRDRNLFNSLQAKNAVIIRKKYAKYDLIRYIRRNYDKICPGEIIYENYSDEIVWGGVDFVIKKTNGKYTLINVYPYSRNASFIGVFLGLVKL